MRLANSQLQRTPLRVAAEPIVIGVIAYGLVRAWRRHRAAHPGRRQTFQRASVLNNL